LTKIILKKNKKRENFGKKIKIQKNKKKHEGKVKAKFSIISILKKIKFNKDNFKKTCGEILYQKKNHMGKIL